VTPDQHHATLQRRAEVRLHGARARHAGGMSAPDHASQRRDAGSAPTRATGASPAGAAVPDLPSRAAGLELHGRFEGSGFKEPPYLARRSDGQVIQLSPLLYLLAEAADGRRDTQRIADAMTERLGRRVTAANVQVLVERKLRPLGILAAADGSTPDLPRHAPLLALRHRRPLVPARVVRLLGGLFMPLFWPPVLVAVLGALAVFDAWLFFSHGIAGGVRSAFYNPALLLAVLGSVTLATAFHEIGHAAACRYGGARPGAMGAALYLIWPAFYCDVTDAYRLSRGGRLRTDLGGVYFNGIFALLAGAAFFATGEEALLLIAVVQHLIIVQQLLPLLRFDGYYVLTDLTGVPDILSRVGPIFRSLRPFRRPERQVTELRPWVRFAVTGYIAALVPLVVILVAWLLIGAPRLFATIFDSLGIHADRVGAAAGAGEWATAALNGLQVGALLLPCLVIGLTFGRLGLLLARGVRSWVGDSTPRKVATVAGSLLMAGFVLFSWGPNGDYRPLQPGERGTIGEGITTLTTAPAGGPASQPRYAAVFRAVPAAHPAQATGSRADAGPRGTTGASALPGNADRTAAAPDGSEEHVPPRDGVPPEDGSGDPGHAVPESSPPSSTPSESPAPAAGAPGPPAGHATDTTAPGGEPEESSAAQPESSAAQQQNRARVINTTDGSWAFQLAFDFQLVNAGRVEHMNIAQAYASCYACRTIAIAVQVVLITADLVYVVPVNFAEAINYECTGCETLAYAQQLVLSTGGDVRLTADARRRTAEIERALEALQHSDASIGEIHAEIDRLMAELTEVVLTGLVRTDDGSAKVAPQTLDGTATSESSSARDAEPPAPARDDAEEERAAPAPAPATPTESEPAGDPEPASDSERAPEPAPEPSATKPEPTSTEPEPEPTAVTGSEPDATTTPSTEP
jgi:putative peptide zinc metalloprotease protein